MPTCTVVGGLGGIGFAISSGSLPVMLITGALGAVLGLFYGAYVGIKVGFKDAVALYEKGWSDTEAGKMLSL